MFGPPFFKWSPRPPSYGGEGGGGQSEADNSRALVNGHACTERRPRSERGSNCKQATVAEASPDIGTLAYWPKGHRSDMPPHTSAIVGSAHYFLSLFFSRGGGGGGGLARGAQRDTKGISNTRLEKNGAHHCPGFLAEVGLGPHLRPAPRPLGCGGGGVK